MRPTHIILTAYSLKKKLYSRLFTGFRILLRGFIRYGPSTTEEKYKMFYLQLMEIYADVRNAWDEMHVNRSIPHAFSVKI